MREIKKLGLQKNGNDKRNYQYSLFLCDSCGNEIVKKSKDGKKATYCSHKCYAKNRKVRGAYKDKVEINGYLYIYKPDHPNSMKSGYVAEHRLVAEKKIGRLLTECEVVHHIDEDKHNNKADNLVVMTPSEHNSYHIKKRMMENGTTI